MRIAAVERFPLALQPAGGGAGPARTIIVVVRAEAGPAGLGEAPVDPADPAASAETLAAWLQRYEAALVGADPTNLNLAHRLLDGVGGPRSAGCPPARAAIDMALHDLVGKARGCPVHQLLGGAYRTSFDVFADVEGDAGDLPAAARAATGRGHRALRVRFGGAARLEEMAAGLIAVLAAVGPEVWVDAEPGASLGNPGRAGAVVGKVLAERFRPNLALRQPLGSDDLAGHAELRERLPIPLVLDGAVTSPEAMAQIVRLAAADRVMLGIERVGGLANAMRIADACEAAAIGVSPASRSLTMIGDAAHCHLAAALHDPYPIHVGDPGRFADSPVAGLDVGGGRAAVGEAPGLGVELDEGRLRGAVAA
jgi:muconate cycloisomerase